MDKFGGALGNLGTGIGKFGTGVAVGATVYHDIYGNKKNTYTADLSATPYHLIWYIIFIDFIKSNFCIYDNSILQMTLSKNL